MDYILLVIAQVQINDGASVQALLNVISGVVSAAVCVWFIYRWHQKMERVALAGWMLFLSVWASVAYLIVLFVDSGVNVVLIRWVLFGWHIAAAGVCIVLHMIQSYDPAELAQQKIKQLEYDNKTAMSNVHTWRDLIEGYKRREEEFAAGAVQMQRALEGAQAELAKMLQEKLAAEEALENMRFKFEEEALKQEKQINALKRQITLMELDSGQ